MLIVIFLKKVTTKTVFSQAHSQIIFNMQDTALLTKHIFGIECTNSHSETIRHDLIQTKLDKLVQWIDKSHDDQLYQQCFDISCKHAYLNTALRLYKERPTIQYHQDVICASGDCRFDIIKFIYETFGAIDNVTGEFYRAAYIRQIDMVDWLLAEFHDTIAASIHKIDFVQALVNDSIYVLNLLVCHFVCDDIENVPVDAYVRHFSKACREDYLGTARWIFNRCPDVELHCNIRDILIHTCICTYPSRTMMLRWLLTTFTISMIDCVVAFMSTTRIGGSTVDHDVFVECNEHPDIVYHSYPRLAYVTSALDLNVDEYFKHKYGDIYVYARQRDMEKIHIQQLVSRKKSARS